MSKYILMSENLSDEINPRLLAALKLVPDIEIGDMTAIGCEIDVADEYVDVLKEHLSELGAEIHRTQRPVLMEPIGVSLDQLRSNKHIKKI